MAGPASTLVLQRVSDFEVTAVADRAPWRGTAWVDLQPVQGPARYATRAKALYSEAGLYVLLDAADRRLTCTMTRDGDDLYKEDVVEIFLHPDPGRPVYFEYEISPLGVELPIVVPNYEGLFHGWLPWHYQGERRARRATTVRGGAKAAMAACEGWTAEVFIPFALLKGLGEMPPRPGTHWMGNLYRIDHDDGAVTQWAWATATGGRFHDYASFGRLEFA